jgi:hypothetical protein
MPSPELIPVDTSLADYLIMSKYLAILISPFLLELVKKWLFLKS